MFKGREEFAAWPTFGRAATPAVAATPSAPPRTVFDRLDIATDLADDIGSRRWWRGVAFLLANLVALVLLWPGFVPLPREGATDPAMLRSLSVSPLALGGDSGAHMAPGSAIRRLAVAPSQTVTSLRVALGADASLAQALLRAGADREDALRAQALVTSAARLSPGTPVDVRLGIPGTRGERPLRSLSLRAGFDLAIAIERDGDGDLSLKSTSIHVDDTPLRIRGVVGPSLYRSARAAGAPPDVVQAYLEQVGQHVDLDEGLLPTDTFDIIVEHRRAASGESANGRLLYAGIDRDQRPHVQLMRWKDRFYEAGGRAEQADALMAPVPGRLTSHFGMRRHPILGYVRMHSGLDFAAAYGTPIVAVTDGVVRAAGGMGGCGAAVSLDHGGGLQTRYCHMSRIAVGSGQQVARGQVIGFVGTSGLSTGSHLHYEMMRGGVPVDPAQVSFISRAQLSGSELARLRQAVAVLKDVEAGAAGRSPEIALSARYGTGREIDRIGAGRRPL